MCVKVERTAVGVKTDLMGSRVSERSRCFALYLGFALKFFAYYDIRSDFAPRLSHAFALLVKDVFESEIEKFATSRLRQSSHGFLEWNIKHTVLKWIPYPCATFSTSTCLGVWECQVSKSDLGTARDNDESQLWGEAIQSANCTLKHLNIGLVHLRHRLVCRLVIYNQNRELRYIESLPATDPFSNLPK